jgi:aconitate hydratase
MALVINPFKTLKTLKQKHYYYSLPILEKETGCNISRLPVSIRIMLESLLRHCDGKKVKEEDVLRLAKWDSNQSNKGDVPFVVSRVLLQDFTGVPLLVDLAAMRDAVVKCGFDPTRVEPLVPVDLVIDHSVQVDRSGTEDAFLFNLKIEFTRNQERYSFLKWGQQAFKTFKIFPPGMGICHQVNLEYLASVVTVKKMGNDEIIYPDTLVGTDSHTTMINGLGVVGWGVGGIEGEAAMLGQPMVFETPEVIGFHLQGALREGITATDLTLRITEILRKAQVVGKFVEFFGEGAAFLSVADRAMIANMAPEYGATMGFFPVDEKTLDYLKMTGRQEAHIALVKEYLQAQGLFGMPKQGSIAYTKVIELDLRSVEACVAGPKRPQDRIVLSDLKTSFNALLQAPLAEGGYGKICDEKTPRVYVSSDGVFSLNKSHEMGGVSVLGDPTASAWSESEMVSNRPYTKPVVNPGYSGYPSSDTILTHGSVVIAAITSCTNTSNPSVMIGAGLLAKKAVEKGLQVNHTVKTSLAPGSRVVTDYLEKTGLQQYLDQLGFQLVAYGCTTCIGNSGPLDERIETAIKEHDLIAASVLSGNRNFEARVHGSVKANFLMSPPLVVAFAIAGRVDIDMDKEPLGYDDKNQPVYLKDIWPSQEEIDKTIEKSISSTLFKKRYGSQKQEDQGTWENIITTRGAQYAWDDQSTYIRNPPYFEEFSLELPPKKTLTGMRALALLGDSVTTDHISPAGGFKKDSAAGKYLLSLNVKESDFNSYGSRRGNHEIMMRGTFANVRIKNKMAEGKEGGFTKLMPEGEIMTIFDASMAYAERKIPLIVFAGKDYGMGSSRDWAAKGAALLGVRVIVARSYERIHRNNLVGMGVLPLQFKEGDSHESLKLKGTEVFSILGLEKNIIPKQEAILEIVEGNQKRQVALIVRIDTPIEIEYYKQGGIMPYVLRHLLTHQP